MNYLVNFLIALCALMGILIVGGGVVALVALGLVALFDVWAPLVCVALGVVVWAALIALEVTTDGR